MTHTTSFDTLRLAGEATTNLTQATVLSVNGQKAARKGFEQLKELASGFEIGLPATAVAMEAYWGNADERALLDASPKSYGLLVADVITFSHRDERTIRMLGEVPAGLLRGEACITQWGAERATVNRLRYISDMHADYAFGRRVRQLANDTEAAWGHKTIKRATEVGVLAVGGLWLSRRRAGSNG